MPAYFDMSPELIDESVANFIEIYTAEAALRFARPPPLPEKLDPAFRESLAKPARKARR
jgi:hypothetical protein